MEKGGQEDIKHIAEPFREQTVLGVLRARANLPHPYALVFLVQARYQISLFAD